MNCSCSAAVDSRTEDVTYNRCKETTKDHNPSNESETCSIVDLQISCALFTASKIQSTNCFQASLSILYTRSTKYMFQIVFGGDKGTEPQMHTKGGKNGMKDGKSGSSPKGSSTDIPSSAFFILCCILNLRICEEDKREKGHKTQKSYDTGFSRELVRR